MGATIELSALEFDVLWEHLELGPFPTVLRVESHGATLDERAELSAKAWQAIAERELGWPTDLDGRLTFRLRLLARPEWEVGARLQLSDQGPRTSALIAANHAAAVIAVRHADRLTMRTRPADRISHEAVTLLPQYHPGTGASITLPADALDSAAARAGCNADAFARALRSLGVGQSEARKIADVTGNVIRFGHFGAARTRTFGKRQRAGHVGQRLRQHVRPIPVHPQTQRRPELGHPDPRNRRRHHPPTRRTPRRARTTVTTGALCRPGQRHQGAQRDGEQKYCPEGPQEHDGRGWSPHREDRHTNRDQGDRDDQEQNGFETREWQKYAENNSENNDSSARPSQSIDGEIRIRALSLGRASNGFEHVAQSSEP